MNVLSTLIFPEIQPDSRSCDSLLLLFDHIFYYQPVEADTEEPPTSPEPAGLPDCVSGYPPAPLGEDRARFKRLLHELSTNPAEHINLFKASATAGLAKKNPAEAAEQSTVRLVDAIMAKPDSNANEQQRERLWQARLTLMLAEKIRRDELEISSSLARISSRERHLLHGIAGPDQEDDLEEHQLLADLPPIPAFSGNRDFLLPRLRAWIQLFLADDSGRRHPVLTTTMPEAFDLLAEHYQHAYKAAPEELFSLTFPNPTGLPYTEYRAGLDAFRTAVLPARDSFADLLQPADGASLQAAELQAAARRWNSETATLATGDTAPHSQLRCYRLPGCSSAALLGLLVSSPQPQKTYAGGHDTLIAVLQR